MPWTVITVMGVVVVYLELLQLSLLPGSYVGSAIIATTHNTSPTFTQMDNPPPYNERVTLRSQTNPHQTTVSVL